MLNPQCLLCLVLAKYSCEFLYVSFNLSSQVKRNIFSPSSQEYPSCVNIVDGFSHDAPERLLHPEPSIIDRLVWRTCLPREARLRPWPPDQRRGEPPRALGHCQREDDRLESRTPQPRRHHGLAIWWMLWPPCLPQFLMWQISKSNRSEIEAVYRVRTTDTLSSLDICKKIEFFSLKFTAAQV